MVLFRLQLFLFCCKTVSGSLFLPNLRLVPNCPSSYPIQGGTSNMLTIEVKNTTNACDKIPQLGENESYPTVSDLNPAMIVSSSGDKSVVNISWNSAIIGKKHPRMYLLELIKYARSREVLSTSCVLLRLWNRKVENSQVQQTIFFDCVELVQERGIYLSVQVWSLPNSKTALTSCPTRRRPKRSPPLTKNCSTVRGKVFCSEEKLFLLSLDDRIPGICHCSDRPNLSLTRLQNGSFRIDAWNLPQYAYKIEFFIYKDGQVVYKTDLDGTTRFNESRSIVTDKVFGPGNYTPVVYAACPGDKSAIQKSGYYCSEMDMVQLEFPMEVPYPVTTRPPKFVPAIHTLIPLLGAFVLSCLVTGIVLGCVLHNRKKRGNYEPPVVMTSQLDTLMPNNETDLFLELAKLKNEKMLIYHPENECHVNYLRRLQSLSESCGFKLVTDTTEMDTTNSVDKTDSMQALPTGIIVNDPLKNTDTVIHDTEITINNRPAVNWRDFAEMAGTDFTEIVILMSAGLYEICRTYQSTDQESFETLRRDRNYDIIPCVVLKKLQTLIQENHQNCKFSVHFVSFEVNSNLIEDFINTFDFLKRGSNYFTYCLSEHHGNDCDSVNNLRLNRTDLKQLFRRLKGLTENEIDQSDLGSIFSDQSFGAELSQALNQTMLPHIENSLLE